MNERPICKNGHAPAPMLAVREEFDNSVAGYWCVFCDAFKQNDKMPNRDILKKIIRDGVTYWQ